VWYDFRHEEWWFASRDDWWGIYKRTRKSKYCFYFLRWKKWEESEVEEDVPEKFESIRQRETA